MRILEIVLFALAIIALILKFLFVPGADEILMISLTFTVHALFRLWFAGDEPDQTSGGVQRWSEKYFCVQSNHQCICRNGFVNYMDRCLVQTA